MNVACTAADCATYSALHVLLSIGYLGTEYSTLVCTWAENGATCCTGAVVARKVRASAYTTHRVCYTILLSRVYRCCRNDTSPYLSRPMTQHHMIYYTGKMLAVGHTPLNTPDPI